VAVTRIVALVVLSALAACAPRVSTAPAPAPVAVTVELVDSIPWENELGDGTLRRVQVRVGARVDTVPGVLTAEPPVVVDGARVLGFVYEDDQVVSGFRYDVGTGRREILALPDDFSGAFSVPSLAPDGRHIAYVVAAGDGVGWGVVRTWPGREPVLATARVEVPATDAPGNFTRWISADTAEIFVETGPSTGVEWYRVRASVARRATVAADTVRTPPWP
jgi:hypothetical protein